MAFCPKCDGGQLWEICLVKSQPGDKIRVELCQCDRCRALEYNGEWYLKDNDRTKNKKVGKTA